MAEPSIPQPTISRIMLLVICSILLTIWIIALVVWGNVAFIVTYGIIFVMFIFCCMSAILRQKKRATGPRRTQTPSEPAPTAFRTDFHRIFIIGGQAVPAGSNHGQPFPQTNISAWRENDPPPPYSELPLQQHGVLAAQSEEAQPTSVVNQNV